MLKFSSLLDIFLFKILVKCTNIHKRNVNWKLQYRKLQMWTIEKGRQYAHSNNGWSLLQWRHYVLPFEKASLRLKRLKILCELYSFFGSLRNLLNIRILLCFPICVFIYNIYIYRENVLKWRTDSNTNLTVVCRHHWSR